MDTVYQKYFDEMPGYVTVQDRDFRIRAANRKFKEDFGECIGKLCYEVYKHRDSKCPICSAEKTFEDGKVYSNQKMIKPLKGNDIHILFQTSPVFDEDGKVESIIEMSIDITEVKRIQEEHRALFDEAPCYISVQNRDLKIVETNRQFREAFGESIGKYCYEAYKHRDKPCPNCLVADTFADGKTHKAEEVVTSKDGERVNVLCYTSPLRNETGDIVSVMEMQTDITEVRQLQSKLSSIGLIVGTTAHDIKGLLGGLRGGNYLVETGIKNDNIKRIKQGWEMTQRNLHRVRNMVLNLLYYSKDREIKWESVDVFKIATDVYDILKDRAKEMKIDFTLDVKEDIGYLEGEINAIHSLLMNLVENAIHACWIDKKKDSHAILFSAIKEDNKIVFTISDNGIGMDQETKEKAFSMFFSSKGSAGTGLGLFVANKVAQNHNGGILIESAPGEGTSFTVTIPVSSPHESKEVNLEDL